MKDYEQVLLWCKTFLLENSFSPYKGNDVAFALLFDMNLLFESYVGSYLKKHGLDVSLQDKGKYLVDVQKKFALKPDIVIRNEKVDEIIIADTKWKILSEDKTNQGVSQADMYQLYAYGTKYKDCKNMFLIYPLDKIGLADGRDYQYFGSDEDCAKKKLNLKVLFFDLEKSFEKDDFIQQIKKTSE